MSQDDDKSPFNWDNWPFIIPDCDPDGPREEETANSSSLRFKEQALRLNAEIGLVSSQLELGLNLLFGKDGFTKDPQEAVQWITAAAEQGDAEARYCLGGCLRFGIGCKQNLKRAVELFRAAAKQGHTGALNNLGYCLRHGLGCKQNTERAVRLFRAAAKRGDAGGKNNYGYCLEMGIGCEKNIDKAFR